jgi:autotransporter translocation and assembly factor TamB
VKKITKKKLIAILILLTGITLFWGVLYWSTHSERGFKSTWGKLVYLIPGSLKWEKLDIDFTRRTLQIKNLVYTHPAGPRVLSIANLKVKFRWTSILRTRVMLENLQMQDINVDLGSLPPRKSPQPISPIFRTLTRRLAIEHSQLTNIRILLKNGEIFFPQGEFTFWPSVIGKDTLHFSFSNIQGNVAERPLSVEAIRYDGEFSVPDMVNEIFIFRKATGTFTMKGAQFDRWKISDLSTQAGFDGKTILFKGVDLAIGQNHYFLKLQFAPFEKRYEGNLSSLKDLIPEEIPGLPPKLAHAFQKLSFSADFKLAGFVIKEMEGNLSLKVAGQGNRINPKTPNWNLTLSSNVKKGRFEISQFSMNNERTKMAGKGFVDVPQKKLDTELSGTGFDLRTFISFFSDIEIYGYADFAGNIKGALNNPDFRFQGRTVEAGYKFMRFGENQGSFEILNGHMRYVGRSPAGASYEDSVDVNIADLFSGERRHTNLKTTFNNLDVSSLLESPDMTGKLSGNYEMEVYQNNKSGKLTAAVKDFKLYQFHLGDMEVQGNLVNNTFNFPPFTFHPPKVEKQTTPRETVFQFDDAGFKFKGSPIAGMEVEGGYLYAHQNVLNISARCANCSVKPLLAALDEPPLDGSIDGKISMELLIGNFESSKMQAQIDRLSIPIGEGEGDLTQSSSLLITYHQGAFHLDKVSLVFNQKVFRLEGSYSTTGPLDLLLTGSLDLGLAKSFREQVRDAGGPAQINLKIRGTTAKPVPSGFIDFQGAFVSLRALRNTIEDLKGKITFDEQKISTENLEGSVEEGDLRISGTLWHDHFKIKKADLKADAREIAYSEPGTYKLILSGKLALTGEDPHFLLAGNLDITEGRYTKNFDIREYILKPAATAPYEEKGVGFENLSLDLKIRSPGELLIKNNIAEIELKSDLQVTGTQTQPIFHGTIEVLDGTFHYFKLSFENAKGVIDFRDPSKGIPYVEINAEKLFERTTEDIKVTVLIQGFTDNLQISFSSDPPLEKREILSLIFTGALPEEAQKISGQEIASSVLANQLTSVLEAPVTGYTHLDIFRLEASDPESKSLSTLVVGKKLTERLSLEFKTDLALEESIKSVQAEYLLLDNVLLKASRSSVGRYRLDLTFRFKGY